jgi:hypothetical protein
MHLQNRNWIYDILLHIILTVGIKANIYVSKAIYSNRFLVYMPERKELACFCYDINTVDITSPFILFHVKRCYKHMNHEHNSISNKYQALNNIYITATVIIYNESLH